MKKVKKELPAEKLDEMFDSGSDEIDDYIDYSSTRHLNLELKRINCDFPAWMVNALDMEAKRLGIARLAVLKTWVAERITSARDSHTQAA